MPGCFHQHVFQVGSLPLWRDQHCTPLSDEIIVHCLVMPRFAYSLAMELIHWLGCRMMLWPFVYKFLYGYVFSVLLGIFLRVDLLGDMLTLCLTFWRTVRRFPKVAALFYILIRNVWKFWFFSCPPTIQLSFLAVAFTTEHITSRMSQIKKEYMLKVYWCLQRPFAARYRFVVIL